MTPGTIQSRAFRNSAVGALSFALNLALTLVLVPVLLHSWETETYGAWLALLAAFSLLQTFDLGHQNFVGNEFNLQFHRDPGLVRFTLGSSLRVAWLLGALELALALALVAGGALPGALQTDAGVAERVRLAEALLALMLMWSVIGSPGGVIARLLVPVGRLHEAQWLGILMRVAQVGAVIVAASLGGGLLAAAVAFTIAQAVVGVVTLVHVRKALPGFYPWWVEGSWGAGFYALRRSLVLTANGIVLQGANGGLVILVATLLGAGALPAFTTLRTVTNTAGAVTTILISSVLPDVVRFHVNRQPEKLEGTLDAHWLLSGALVNGGIVLLLPVLGPLYGSWTRGRIPFDLPLFLCLLVATSLVNFGSGLTAYLASVNDIRSQLLLSTTRMFLTLGATLVLVRPLGILAAGVGCVMAEVGASVILPLVLARQRLVELGSPRALGHWRLALVPPVALALLGWLPVRLGIELGWVSLMLVPILAAAFLAHWRGLGQDVRARIASLAVRPGRARGEHP